jgi:NAD(P)-dependent dehydrogenase (short-subunit alcohol dehydrogenase family)
MVSRDETRSQDLLGAVVVVTGGAAGIGQALAIEAALRGASVMVGDIGDASETIESVIAAGGRGRWVHCDAGVKADIVALRDATVAEFGGVNVVCSNVGTGAVGPLHLVSDEDFEQTIRVNVTGSFWVLKVFAPDLISAAGQGRPAAILFTGSEHSLGVPPADAPPYVPPASVYTMSKQAILGMAAVARRDLAPAGVHAAILCPGWTAVDTLRKIAKADEHYQMVLNTFSQEPSFVAACAFEGLEQGEYIIPTNPISRDFVVGTHQEIINAMESAAKL